MTIEEMLRAGEVQNAENGLVFAVLNAHSGTNGASSAPLERSLERMVSAVPRSLVPRLGRSATYFVPWLHKQKRSVAIADSPAEEGENRKELCHHLDVKPHGNLLLISLNFYEHDSYGLAMEFYDKVAYLAALHSDTRRDFYDLLAQQLTRTPAGELTAESWEWRSAAQGDVNSEAWQNYLRAAESDTLGVYMAALFTDVFYDDLMEPDQNFPALPAEQVYERVRVAERLFPPNHGYSFQVVRQRARRCGNR